MKFLKTAIVATSLCAITSTAMALPILDQHNDPSNSASYNGSSGVSGSIMQGQTFTVGLSGKLVELDVRLAGSGFGNTLFVDIRKLSGAHPSSATADVLGTQQIQTAAVSSTADFVSLFFDVPVTAGEKLAFVVYQKGTGGSISLSDVVSASSDPYLGGSLWTAGNSNVANGGWYANGNSASNFDAGFRTFVDNGVVPEPASLALVAVALVGVGVSRKRTRA